MFTVEQVLSERYPALQRRHPVIRSTLAAFLRLLFHERRFRQFAASFPHLEGMAFVDKVLEHFDFSYSVRNNERERVPVSGALVVVANHPIGSLDGLALLSLLGGIRKDVRVVANDVLMAITPLRPLLMPVDAMQGRTARDNIRAIEAHLAGGGAIVIFPAGEVSRLSPRGVRDGRWRTGFLRMARRARADVLPVHVDGRNSMLFYSLSFLARPLSTLLLVHEMFRQSSNSVQLRIGHVVTPSQYTVPGKRDEWLAGRLRTHVYSLRRARARPLFPPAGKPVAHPENRQLLKLELRDAQVLGETRDGKRIALVRGSADSALMREIGRLREIAFRSVGEGTGERRDLDRFDPRYEHIVLWDDNDLEIVGAYRLARAAEQLAAHGNGALYSQTLFEFGNGMSDIWPRTLELGRSFVQPRYWGRRGLDYLWQGIGAYLRQHPELRFMLGPVSISNAYPTFAKELLVAFYAHYHPDPWHLAAARMPWTSGLRRLTDSPLDFSGEDYEADFQRLRAALAASGLQVPTLLKQYTEAVQVGGASFLAFNVDPDFGWCIDGLILLDLDRLKASHRARYLQGGRRDLPALRLVQG